MSEITRSYPLDDITIQRGGDGRTVEAYAAVFDTPAPVNDQWGRYEERIDRSAFNKAINDARPAGSRSAWRCGVFYNHGLTIHGTPSERGSVPLGVPLEIDASDGRGVRTVTRYNRSELADEILEGITSGAIRGQSFTGAVRRSDKPTPRGGFRPNPDGSLQVVTRMEMGLKEYGPTPFPVYETAGVIAVRATDLAAGDANLLQQLLTTLAASDAALDPFVTALSMADGALDQAQALIAYLLSVPDPDEADTDDGMVMNSAALTSLATRLNAAVVARSSSTTDRTPSGAAAGAATDEPPSGHSGRNTAAPNWAAVGSFLRTRGIKP